MTSTRIIRAGILFFWAAYFTVVVASNATDALKALGLLPDTFSFASGNYALVHKVTRIYEFPTAIVALLFAGVVAWELAVAILFWRSFLWDRRGASRAQANTAFAAGLGLWAAFILADELLIAYEVAGLEGTHVALLSAQLLSLLVFHSKLGRQSGAPDPAGR